MKTIEFLNQQRKTLYTKEACLVQLTVEYSIKVTHHEPTGLYVLNYSQIGSPKLHEITKECRSLVIEFSPITGFSVVSRAFDRFFNFGESGCEFNSKDITSNNINIVEKKDGSLITLFNYEGEWLYRTKGMIMPTLEINGICTLWKDLIEPFFDHVTADRNKSYIFELTSFENRVVVKYDEPEMTLLAIRCNIYFDYSEQFEIVRTADINCWNLPDGFYFESLHDMLTSIKNLRNLEEGVVIYQNGIPVAKVKNPAYVAAHHLRGEGLNHRRIMDLVFMNETAEYLNIFPEDSKHINPYLESYEFMTHDIIELYNESKDIESQKEYAIKVKDYPYAGIMFNMRQGKTLVESLKACTINTKYRMLESFMNL